MGAGFIHPRCVRDVREHGPGGPHSPLDRKEDSVPFHHIVAKDWVQALFFFFFFFLVCIDRASDLVLSPGLIYVERAS
jgi:hypothetical protein